MKFDPTTYELFEFTQILETAATALRGTNGILVPVISLQTTTLWTTTMAKRLVTCTQATRACTWTDWQKSYSADLFLPFATCTLPDVFVCRKVGLSCVFFCFYQPAISWSNHNLVVGRELYSFIWSFLKTYVGRNLRLELILSPKPPPKAHEDVPAGGHDERCPISVVGGAALYTHGCDGKFWSAQPNGIETVSGAVACWHLWGIHVSAQKRNALFVDVI